MATRPPSTIDDDRRHANRARRNTIQLSRETAAKCEAGLNAWGVLRKTFTQWLTIGEAVIAMRSRAEEIGGRATFKRIMHQQGFGDLVDARGKAILSKLEKIMQPENLPRVMEWHQKLSAKEQIAWSSPSSVVRQCPIFAKPATSVPRLPGQRREMPPEQRVEYAIDVITGYCMKMPTERDAILRRILGPLDLELAALKEITRMIEDRSLAEALKRWAKSKPRLDRIYHTYWLVQAIIPGDGALGELDVYRRALRHEASGPALAFTLNLDTKPMKPVPLSKFQQELLQLEKRK